MSQLILEAFRELKGLKEDIFSFDKQGALDLKDFLHADRKEPTEVDVIDPEADSEQDLKPSYDGEVILSCCACHGLISKSPKDVVIDPDTQRVNVDEECPCCFNKVGYRVMAQIPGDRVEEEQQEVVDEVPADDENLAVDTENITVEEKEDEEPMEESMKTPLKEAVSVVPAPFDQYYYIASEEEAKSLSEDDVDEVQWFKDDFGVDFIGWAVAKDQYFDQLAQDGYEYAAVYSNNGTTELGTVIGGRLFSFDFDEDVKPLVECAAVTEGKKKTEEPDLWDKVYGALGEDGEQVRNPNSEKGTYRFNIGAGYGYERLNVDGDGNIVIRATSEEELEPAKAAVEPFADQGVTYEIKFSKYDKKRPYAIVVHVPFEDLEECKMTEEVVAKDYEVYYRDGKDGEWELDDVVRGVTDINAHMDKYAEWLDDDSTPRWSYDPDTLIVSDGYGQEYKFVPVEDKPLTEAVENITVETDGDKITVKPSEDGKVSVEAEPKVAEAGALEPVDPDVQAEIEANSGLEDTPVEGDDDLAFGGEIEDLATEEPVDDSEEDIDITDFDEEAFNELGESYLKKVYENVASFKTTRGYAHDDKIKLEGVIKFNSGKEAKTSFLFEGLSVTKRGKYKMIGENIQITNRKNAFILAGTVNNGNFLSEALTYNYTAKDAATGKSTKLYGTVRTKK